MRRDDIKALYQEWERTFPDLYVEVEPLEACLQVLDLLLLYLYLLLPCSELVTAKTILKHLDYELLAELRTVLGADRGIYRFRQSSNPRRHTWFTTERPFMSLLRNRSDDRSLSNYDAFFTGFDPRTDGCCSFR